MSLVFFCCFVSNFLVGDADVSGHVFALMKLMILQTFFYCMPLCAQCFHLLLHLLLATASGKIINPLSKLRK